MGLENGNNLCFANAVVQCLRACTTFAGPRYLGRRMREPHEVVTRLRELVAADLLSPKAGASASKLVQTVARLHPDTIRWGQENDACEFLMLMIDDICDSHASLKPCFFGEVLEEITCAHCADVTAKPVPFGVILLYAARGAHALPELIVKMFGETAIDARTCDKCGGKGATRVPVVTALPDVLVLNTADVFELKVREKMTFKCKNRLSRSYRLKGVVNYAHRHYACAVAYGGQYYACNDAHVTVVDADAFLRYASTRPRVLFFECEEPRRHRD